MKTLEEKKQLVINFVIHNANCSSKQIHTTLQEHIAYATVKRLLQKLIAGNFIVSTGTGKTTKYSISTTYELLHLIDVNSYFEKEIDERSIKKQFNFVLLKETLLTVSVFTADELLFLNNLQAKYQFNSSQLSVSEYSNALERLAIDLSWKSSQIEGNTYSLLETERLLKDKETASGKTRDEATMLLNHKHTLDFIIENTSYIKPLSVAKLEAIHSLLVKELGINKNIRTRKVGISGTNYTPLDNEFQIKEALEDMCLIINKENNTFAKAFLALLFISYIQAFSDGNKRTARIVSNALLINNNYCPISFRTVNSIDYKKAMLIFYEQNNMSAFKTIFIQQFEFAVSTYF
ncbi:MAG: Fic family protein [Bacteroidia bacterium]